MSKMTLGLKDIRYILNIYLSILSDIDVCRYLNKYMEHLQRISFDLFMLQ